MKTEVAHLRLRRETDRVALLRLEKAARTMKDFETVVEEWNRIDKNRRRRERRYEDRWVPYMLDELKEDFSDETLRVFPPPQKHAWWRKLQAGDFLDKIFDCPHDLHELTSHKNASDAVKKLKPEHKEMIYYRTIRQWSPQKLAAVRGQTDRNIRKVYDTAIRKVRREMGLE